MSGNLSCLNEDDNDDDDDDCGGWSVFGETWIAGSAQVSVAPVSRESARATSLTTLHRFSKGDGLKDFQGR